MVGEGTYQASFAYLHFAIVFILQLSVIIRIILEFSFIIEFLLQVSSDIQSFGLLKLNCYLQNEISLSFNQIPALIKHFSL